MEFAAVLIVAALVFGVCYLIDKVFTKTFRAKAQHKSGLSVRLNKKYGSIGLIIGVIGLAAMFTGIPGNWLLIAGGCLLMVIGIGLVVYYMTFGLFYDDEQFVLTTFGKRSTVYYYRDIRSQQLYNAYGNIVIELHLADGRTAQLQSGMEGVYPFLDRAYGAWLRQTGRTEEDCPFHDPDNSCWFPPMED